MDDFHSPAVISFAGSIKDGPRFKQYVAKHKYMATAAFYYYREVITNDLYMFNKYKEYLALNYPRPVELPKEATDLEKLIEDMGWSRFRDLLVQLTVVRHRRNLWDITTPTKELLRGEGVLDKVKGLPSKWI